MSRRSESTLRVRENESACPEEKAEAPFPLLKDQQACTVPKPKASRASKKENVSDGNQAQPRKRALKHPRGLGEESPQPGGHPGGCFGAPQRGVDSEPTLPWHGKENGLGSRSGCLGSDFCWTPEWDRVEGKPDFGASEEQGNKPVDFATVTIADFGIAPGSFTKGCKGNSPTSLKFRRRSTIGLRGSPENNTLIRYLAQQRGSRQSEAVTEISPFKRANVRPLKDKMEAFQTSFESLQEAEEKTEFPGLAHVDDASQEGASCKLIKYSDSRSDHSTADTRSDVLSDPSRKKVGFVKELSLGMFDESKALVTPPVTTPVTPRQTGNIPLNGLTQGGSLRSILKKTPKEQLMDSPKEYLSDAVDREGESLPVSYCEKAFEASETGESTESLNFKTPKKKKVTFGEVLSPEIFDQSLPANTPLRRGASPGCALSSSLPARPLLTAEPLPRLHWDCEEECAEPLQEVLEGPVAAEDPLPVESAEAQTDKPDEVQPRFSTKRKEPLGEVQPSPKPLSPQRGAQPGQAGGSSWAATGPGNAENTRKPRKKSKIQGLKDPTTSAPKRTQKPRRAGSGRRRKRKVKKSLYGQREMASKKPLLSPIPEIPEVLSSVSSPDSPKADPLSSEDEVLENPKSRNVCKGVQEKAVIEGMREKNICAVDVYPSSEELGMAAPGSSRDGTLQESDSGTDLEISSVVPDAGGDFDTSEDFQQGNESACENEAKESSSLMENEQLQENLLPGLEFLEQQAKDVLEGAQGTQAESGKASLARRRRRRSSSAIYFPPVENLEITGLDLSVSSYNVEDVLSVPKGSFQAFGRKSSMGGEMRVRRSMRLSKDAASEGLAWVQLPGETPGQPLLPYSAPKGRRRISTSILTGSENLLPREQNPILFSALGKENEDSAHLADGPCRRWRRNDAATTQKTPGAQAKKRRITNSVNKKDRNSQNHPEEAEMPLEVTPGDVLALSDFLK